MQQQLRLSLKILEKALLKLTEYKSGPRRLHFKASPWNLDRVLSLARLSSTNVSNDGFFPSSSVQVKIYRCQVCKGNKPQLKWMLKVQLRTNSRQTVLPLCISWEGDWLETSNRQTASMPSYWNNWQPPDHAFSTGLLTNFQSISNVHWECLKFLYWSRPRLSTWRSQHKRMLHSNPNCRLTIAVWAEEKGLGVCLLKIEPQIIYIKQFLNQVSPQEIFAM